MKIRLGFVSNSSSSSYTCEVCGDTQSGFDQGPEELGMAQCENGHIVCEDHLLDWPEPKDIDIDEDDEEIIDEFEEEYDDAGKNQDGEYNILRCPICQMEKISSYDITEYLFRITDRTKADLVKEIKNRFKTYEEFSNFLRNKE